MNPYSNASEFRPVTGCATQVVLLEDKTPIPSIVSPFAQQLQRVEDKLDQLLAREAEHSPPIRLNP